MSVCEDFLKGFEETSYPDGFLEDYEPLEYMSGNPAGETLCVRERKTGQRFVAKCFREPAVMSSAAEGEILRKLSYSGLPAYAGEYKSDGILCVVREYVPGMPLDRFVFEHRISEKRAVSICEKLCDILEYIHGQSPPVIHRDIKPQNIIVSGETVKLIDFGISRVFDENARTDTVSFGTASFAPPEQYGFSQTDGRSDIFSLGVVLCWLLTGDTDIRASAGRIGNKKLARIVRKCTAFDPNARYTTAAHVKNALAGRAGRKTAALICAAAALAAAVFIWGEKPSGAAVFKEPLIERAVRLSLSKDESEPVTKQELLSVSEVFVFGDNAAANYEDYSVYASRFAAGDKTLSRGGISSLEDIGKLKNLKRLYLAYQNISDLSPLSGLSYLESAELKHNPVADVSPLRGLTSLEGLFIFDTKVSDLRALAECPRLFALDIGHTQTASVSALEGLDSLKILMMRETPVGSLSGIESHKALEEIYISGTGIYDLTPLLGIPGLKTVEADAGMGAAAESAQEGGEFNIVYKGT